MSSTRRTSLYVPLELAARIRDIADRERRQIVDVLERMTDHYEPLTLGDHAILYQIADELHLSAGEALSHVIHDWSAARKAVVVSAAEAP